jgi:hypothetical protein
MWRARCNSEENTQRHRPTERFVIREKLPVVEVPAKIDCRTERELDWEFLFNPKNIPDSCNWINSKT